MYFRPACKILFNAAPARPPVPAPARSGQHARASTSTARRYFHAHRRSDAMQKARSTMELDDKMQMCPPACSHNKAFLRLFAFRFVTPSSVRHHITSFTICTMYVIHVLACTAGTYVQKMYQKEFDLYKMYKKITD